MKHIVFFLTVLTLIPIALPRAQAADGPAAIAQPGPGESPAQRDARMAWWREARFGMFVHWGLYSGLAGTWDGKPVGTQGGMEWIQQRVKADTDTYAQRRIPLFKPTPGFAREWARLAKAGGLPLRRLHHQAPRRLRPARLEGQRLRRRLGAPPRPRAAKSSTPARAEGLRVGFYHSVIDWHHDQYAYAKSKQLPHPLKASPIPTARATTPSTSTTCTPRSTNWSRTTARSTSCGGTTARRISRATRPGGRRS